jgi:hypothetical protein
MALLCDIGDPGGYDDNNNEKIQILPSEYDRNGNRCLLVNPGLTSFTSDPDSQIRWFDEHVSGFRVRPGHRLSLYFRGDGTDLISEFDGGNEGKNVHLPNIDRYWNDRTDSVILKKDCNTNAMTWDNSCLNPSDPSKYIGNNLQNRKNACSSNLNGHSNCYNWCNVNRAVCSTAIQKYCEALPINTMVNDQICSDLKNQIIRDRCTTESDLFSTDTCKTFCGNNANECIKSAQTYCGNVSNFNSATCKDFCKNNIEICKSDIQSYCGNNFNQTCKDYCKDTNLGMCISAIKKYCSGNTINTDPYCKPILLDPLLRGQHNTEMDIYCNNEGRNDLSKITPSTAKKTFKETDILTNPICACFDKELIAEKFKYIKNSNKEIYDEFTSKPECWYSECKRDIGVYQKSNPNCHTTICAIDIGQIDAQFAKDIQIENNCGNDALTTGETNVDGTQSNDPTSTNKIDCKMSDWSECSMKCGVGTKTRKKIIGPLNGGEECGVLVEKCDGPCKIFKTLLEQLQNGTFNFNNLDQDNKIILIVIIILIIIFFV